MPRIGRWHAANRAPAMLLNAQKLHSGRADLFQNQLFAERCGVGHASGRNYQTHCGAFTIAVRKVVSFTVFNIDGID
ncbi:hypothetical protein KCP74_01965 [Salmonella enterica subsp. enterica]|nr:hypothetical protein KCP74_01965 [Salmonella enterica subsp. enterica]